MNIRRLLGGAVALALAGATVVAAPTQAAVTGTGASSVTTRLLEIDLGSGGSLLGLGLVGEEALSTNAKDAAAAVARLHTFSSSSDVVDLLDLTGPVIEAKSGSSPATVTAPAVDLGAPAPGVTVPSAVLAGRVVPQPLVATVDASGARAASGASVEDLSLAGGLVSAGRLTSTLGSESLTTSAAGVRSVRVENVRVLDLGALLAGLGIDLSSLSVDTVSKLVDGLKLPVTGLDAEATLESTVETTVTTINGLVTLLESGSLTSQQLVPDSSTNVLPGTDTIIDTITTEPELPAGTDPVTDTVGGVVGTIDATTRALLESVGLDETATLDDVLRVIQTLQGDLGDLLESALKALEAAPLLTIGAIELGLSSKATDSVDTSMAAVTAKVEGVKVGELGSLAGVELPLDADLGAITAQINTLVGTVEAEIGKVLGQIAPGLAGIVDVALFEELEDVVAEGDTVKAVAGLTALTATITPPADLAGIVDGLVAASGIGDVLASVNIEVPTLEAAMGTLNGLLTGVTGAGAVSAAQVPDLGSLASGATLRVGTLASTSMFTPTPASVTTPDAPGAPSVPTVDTPGAPSAPATPTELPRTGAATWVLLAAGMLLIATGLGLPQWADAAVHARAGGRRRTTP